MKNEVENAVAGLGSEPLTEASATRWLRPLFREALAFDGIYLANHTLGRPLDGVAQDVAEGLRLWPEKMRGAWSEKSGWLAEEHAYRHAIAQLLGMTHESAVVPKTSAGAALRAVLHTLPHGATVLTTDAEFVSVAVVLAQFEALGRLRVVRTHADAGVLARALESTPGVQLVVVSHVLARGGRIVNGLPQLAAACHGHGAKLLVDAYHSLGVLPFTLRELGCDYLIGGCYKYLRGGPGAAFLALAPSVEHVRPAETSWFALAEGADPWAQGGPQLREGGDAWLEGTPPVLVYYAARSGLAFVRAVGVARLREYSLHQLRLLKAALREQGLSAAGGDEQHGAFLSMRQPQAAHVAAEARAQGLAVDARDGAVRVCPDVLTTEREMVEAAEILARCIARV